jgi:CspA family cold shock protein
MPNGVVKWFDKRKGWGFITQESGEDIFVHYSQILAEGFRTLVKGDRVTFDLGRTEKGVQAEHVVRQEQPPGEPPAEHVVRQEQPPGEPPAEL